MVYRLMINTEEAAMLAEIFVLRLENQLRAEKDAARAEKLGFVPIPAGALVDSRKRHPAELRKSK